MSYETDLIRKIRGGMSAIKAKTKTPKDANLAGIFLRLKQVNEGQYDDLIKEYKGVLESIKEK